VTDRSGDVESPPQPGSDAAGAEHAAEQCAWSVVTQPELCLLSLAEPPEDQATANGRHGSKARCNELPHRWRHGQGRQRHKQSHHGYRAHLHEEWIEHGVLLLSLPSNTDRTVFFHDSSHCQAQF
jgi:hypothetical protein